MLDRTERCICTVVVQFYPWFKFLAIINCIRTFLKSILRNFKKFKKYTTFGRSWTSLSSKKTGLVIFCGKKKQNFAGFSGANSQKNWPISRDFSGKKSNFEGLSGANS